MSQPMAYTQVITTSNPEDSNKANTIAIPG